MKKYSFGFKTPEPLTELNLTAEEENELLQISFSFPLTAFITLN
jgi:hypothetical protein